MLASFLANKNITSGAGHLVAMVDAEYDPGSNAGVNLSNVLKLSDGQPVSTVFETPADMVNLLVGNAFIVAGIFLFILIILAGFKFISSDSKGIEEAKTLIMNAGIGFSILFGAYWVVQIIQFVTGIQIFF